MTWFYWPYLDGTVLGVLVFVAWFAPRLGDAWFAKIEKAGARFAGRKSLAVFAILILTIVLRVSLLGVMPVEPPGIHDEFSYLLAGDTFAHGRLANPPHAMAVFFDTFHVLQQPTYASIYFPAQGVVLALGQLLGQAWIGVLLSMAAMCAAMLWMSQGWLPARWALLGAILVLVRFGIVSYWINGYWGGAVPALGGALVMGALPRILRRQHPRHALLLGLGAAVLATSRPFEGLVLCLPVAAVFCVWLAGKRSPPLRVTLPRVVLPVAAVLFFTAAFTLYYDWRVTTDPFLFPYTLNLRTHEIMEPFVWEKSGAVLRHANPQFDAFYEKYQFHGGWAELRRASWEKLAGFYDFFLGPALLAPFAAAWRVLFDRRMRFLGVQCLFCFAGMFAAVWYFPHYSAPLMATFFCILLQSLRHLRRWKFRGQPVGIGLTRAVFLSVLITLPVCLAQVIRDPTGYHGLNRPGNWKRARMLEQLAVMPGDQLVVVRYSADKHNVDEEWVYNDADIDHAKVVWAREIPGLDMRPLLEYFRGRHVWLAEPDLAVPRLSPYSGTSQLSP